MTELNPLPIAISKSKLVEFCERHCIRKLSLFGSVLRDDFSLESDVDVLVEFEPGKTPGFAIVAMQQELSEMVGGRKVDLSKVGNTRTDILSCQGQADSRWKTARTDPRKT
jgi:predicted nucleotidyltransferase